MKGRRKKEKVKKKETTKFNGKEVKNFILIRGILIKSKKEFHRDQRGRKI